MHILNVLRETLSDDAVLAIDGGSIGQWAHQLHCDRYPGHWLTCGRSGVVGWGLGGAMGARLVFPGRPVILLSGDGSFTFGPAEIECAVRQRLPFVAIVADDQAWGITRAGHEAKFGEAISSTLGPLDFVKMAEAFGARGVTARSEAEIRAALRAPMDSGEVTVIHVPIVGGNP
jgi:acetolactate synthase-1/2/3 large subunit